MLVKGKRNLGGIVKGKLYVVYAICENSHQKLFAIIPVGSNMDGHNPYFHAGAFESVADRVTGQWVTQKIDEDSVNTYTSFPEFFAVPDFWARFHDGSLTDLDLDVLNGYQKRYEQMYADLIAA